LSGLCRDIDKFWALHSSRQIQAMASLNAGSDNLGLGSFGELAAALDREGIRPKPRILANATTIAAERFMVGPLAHMLKNRFYVGDVVYKGEVHKGDHEAILNRDLFDAVQARLAERKVQRRLTRSKSPAILVGLIFDDRGNPMSPSHANKKGVRYRYYVTHALLQNRKDDAGSIARVPAPDIELLVCNAVKRKKQSDSTIPDRDLLQQHVERVTVRPKELEITLRSSEGSAEAGAPTLLSIPFAPNLPRRKGVTHAPAAQASIDAETRATLLQAIARARSWIDSILSGKAASFDDIATAEGLAERHVRRLAVLTFLSPKIIQAIADGSAPADLTVSRLTQALPHAWSAQEQMVGLR
jgi:site-specific DNA recombinase